AGGFMPVLPQGWSLNMEMFFYLFVTLSLFLPRKWQLPCLTAGLAAVVAAGAILLPRENAFDFYSSGMVFEFVAGLWIGQFRSWQALPGRRGGIFLFAAGLAGFAAAQALGILAENMRPCVPAVLLVLGAVSVEADGGVFRSRLLKMLGDASYSIYL